MTFKEIVSNIRKTVWARDVRENIAQGMEYLDEVKIESEAVTEAVAEIDDKLNKKIDERTIRVKETVTYSDDDNTTPDPVYKPAYGGSYLNFTSKIIRNDITLLQVDNASSNNECLIFGYDSTGVETSLGVITPNTSKIIDVSSVFSYKFEIIGQGPYDADISKFTFTEYVDVFNVIDSNKEQADKKVDMEFFQSVESFIEEFLKKEEELDLYNKIYVIRDGTTPALIVRYATDGFEEYAYTTNQAFYDDLTKSENRGTGVQIGHYFIGAIAEAIHSNQAVLDEIVTVPYTKNEVNELINTVNQFNVAIVSELPTDKEKIDKHTIYFVPKETTGAGDSYDEYIYIDDKWEHIGNTVIDLSGYVTNQRKIAELTLEKDITASELQAKLKESDGYSSDVTEAWLERFDEDIKGSQKFKTAIAEETAGKVDKETGKSLVEDTEIEKLKNNVYTKTEIDKMFNDYGLENRLDMLINGDTYLDTTCGEYEEDINSLI